MNGIFICLQDVNMDGLLNALNGHSDKGSKDQGDIQVNISCWKITEMTQNIHKDAGTHQEMQNDYKTTKGHKTATLRCKEITKTHKAMTKLYKKMTDRQATQLLQREAATEAQNDDNAT